MTRVYRHEYKYRISTMSAELLKYRLSLLMRPDKNAGDDGSYFIRSLYFDDIQHTAFHEKLWGVSQRAKYRLRFYNHDSKYTIFEKKEKSGIYMCKQTVKTSPDQVNAIMSSDWLNLSRDESPLLKEYGALCTFRHMTPQVIVDYDRTAFTYPISNVRVTLDTDLRTAPYKYDMFDRRLATIPIYPEGEQLLEVKFNEFLPEVIRLALDDIPKVLVANSKYALCLSVVLE